MNDLASSVTSSICWQFWNTEDCGQPRSTFIPRNRTSALRQNNSRTNSRFNSFAKVATVAFSLYSVVSRKQAVEHCLSPLIRW